jgi:hypothetical protein
MAAQMKAFFDSTGQLWREQKLVGKTASSLSALTPLHKFIFTNTVWLFVPLTCLTDCLCARVISVLCL